MSCVASNDYAVDPEMYELLIDMKHNIHDLKELYSHAMFSEDGIYKELTQIAADMTELRQDLAVLKSDVADLKDDMKEVRQDIKEIRGEVREMAGSLSGMQTRLNWWLVIAGVVIAVLQYFRP